MAYPGELLGRFRVSPDQPKLSLQNHSLHLLLFQKKKIFILNQDTLIVHTFESRNFIIFLRLSHVPPCFLLPRFTISFGSRVAF